MRPFKITIQFQRILTLDVVTTDAEAANDMAEEIRDQLSDFMGDDSDTVRTFTSHTVTELEE
jgi:hypothetical protein